MKIKFILKICLRFILKIFYIFPVKKNIIFLESFDGNELCCSPYYIYDYLRNQNTKYKFIISTKISKKNNNGVRYVKTKSFSWVLAQIYSGIQIINTGFKFFIPYRKNQILINTWHGGGAYKRVGNADNAIINSKYLNKSNEYVNKHLTYFISSSREFSKVMKESLLIPEEKFLNIGLPRNDIFFNSDRMEQSNLKIRKKYNISENDFVVLYAPTYRGSMVNANFSSELDCNKLKIALSQKTKKKILLTYRGHYFIHNSSTLNSVDFDWSNEPNMQDLLCCADLLITDYSSSMWDFSYTGKPCFLFVPDIDSYLENRGFYTDPLKWGFSICKTNDELAEKIMTFDKAEYEKAVVENHKFFGSFEEGNATKKIVDIINRINNRSRK